MCVALYPVGVLLHELGHALAALKLGMRVARVSIGRYGPQFFAIKLFNCTFEVRLILYGGATVIWFKNAKQARSRYLTAIL
ncbi:MAG TPA: site-2 protease family protein, partial [Gemmataceae bacterium]|nr:site-2 protease family protein [Gemmataceae bacterium]